MEIIPVIDLKADRVVRARMGQRHLYQGIETILSPASDSLSITAGLLSLYPFGTLYVADLDAIEGRGDHRAVLTQLKARHPQLMLWVDNGIANADAAAAWLDTGLGCLVLGSETQRDICVIRDLVAHQRVVLSLDFRSDAFQGPPELLEQPHIWP